jgi:hypothetical protein
VHLPRMSFDLASLAESLTRHSITGQLELRAIESAESGCTTHLKTEAWQHSSYWLFRSMGTYVGFHTFWI